MANEFFSFTPFDFGIEGGSSPPQLEDYDKDGDTVMFNVGKADHLLGHLHDQMEEMNTLSSQHGLNEEVAISHFPKDQNQQQQSKPSFLNLDDFNFEIFSSQHGFYEQQQSKSSLPSLENFGGFDFSLPSAQVTQTVEDGARFTLLGSIRNSNIVESNTQMSQPPPPPQLSLVAQELLNSYGSSFKNLKGDKRQSSSSSIMAIKANEAHQQSNNLVIGKEKLSTEEVMRVAGARYVQFSSQGYDDSYMPICHFGNTLSGLCEQEMKDVELAHLLLATAEKVGYQQFERASRLLLQCELTASSKGTTVERVVCYFAEALRERIAKETGMYGPVELSEEVSQHIHGLGTNLAYIAFYQEVPFKPVLQFAAIQTIIETVANEKRIHLIDLEIRSGVQWTGFMEALAERGECRVELLTITAVGIRGMQKIKETGERLASVAESLKLPFEYKEVIVSDMLDIKDHLFYDIDDDEAVIVYAPLVLRTMLTRPRCLESLMRVMKNINPCLMVIIEVEANHNSPSFVNRFIDALFYYSAFFDCLETCMKQENYKEIIEGFLREGIRNIVAAEGSERVSRSVKMDVWRSFFARLRMVEVSFSNSSLYQASLLAKKYSSTTFEKNGKCLIVGWKGTPIHSLSAWKFR